MTITNMIINNQNKNFFIAVSILVFIVLKVPSELDGAELRLFVTLNNPMLLL